MFVSQIKRGREIKRETEKGGGEEERELEREGDGWNEARTNVVLSSAIRLVECYFRRTERILSVLLGEWLINTAEVIERGEGGGERGGIMFPGNRKDDDGRVLNKPPVDLSAHLKSPRGVHLASSRCTFARLMSLNWLTWIINLNSFFFFFFLNYLKSYIIWSLYCYNQRNFVSNEKSDVANTTSNFAFLFISLSKGKRKDTQPILITPHQKRKEKKFQ